MPNLTVTTDVDAMLAAANNAAIRTAIGLGSVTNTSDAGKPVSTAQQTALDLKANLAGPTFTGVPSAPTAAAATNTTQLATTAFVRTEVANLVASSPAALDTLDELAAALGDDANFAATVTAALALKATTAALLAATSTYAAKTANYTLVATDYIINCTSNSFTVTLLSAVGIGGKTFQVKNSGTGIITVATTSSQAIDGAASVAIAQYESLTLCSDGANWILL